MYSILPCEKMQNNIFNLKKDLSLKNKYLEQYKLLNTLLELDPTGETIDSAIVNNFIN